MFSGWLQSFDSDGTRRTYGTIIRLFLRFVFETESSDMDDLTERYVRDRKDEPKKVMREIDRFNSERVRKLAPKTQQNYISALRTFISEMYLDVPDSYWRKYRRRTKARVLLKDRPPTSKELRMITQHLTAKGRGFYLFMSAAGTRIRETLLVEFRDLDMDVDPPRVHLRAETTKGRQERVVFFTAEAREAIEEWLKVRKVWMGFSRTRHYAKDKELNRERVFPFSVSNARQMWVGALKKSGLYEQDEATGYATLRPHTLRKRFRTQLGAVIPVDVVESLMGHAGYETGAYRRYTEEELADHYRQGEHVLYLSADRAEVERLQRDVQREKRDREEEMDDLKRRIVELELDREQERRSQ